jgi:hypothetical protein
VLLGPITLKPQLAAGRLHRLNGSNTEFRGLLHHPVHLVAQAQGLNEPRGRWGFSADGFGG